MKKKKEVTPEFIPQPPSMVNQLQRSPQLNCFPKDEEFRLNS